MSRAPPLELDAPELVRRLAYELAVTRAAVVVEPALRLRQGAPAAALVWVRLGQLDAVLSAATARQAAVHVAISAIVARASADPAALALRFTQAADQADAMAAAQLMEHVVVVH